MSEFEDKLGAILGNPEAMGQIMSLAKSLGGSNPAPSEAQISEVPPSDMPVDAQEADEPAAVLPGAGDLLSSLGNLDPRILKMAMGLFSEYSSGDDKKTALLTALRPFVKEERFAKVDRAIQIAKISRLIRVGLDAFKKEGDPDV